MATPARGATISIYTIRANFSGGNLDAGWNAAYNTNMLNMAWYRGRYYYSGYYGYRYFPGSGALDIYTYFTAATGNCNCCCQCCCGGCCFNENSLVLMRDGSQKRICDIVEGDQVVNSRGSYNTVKKMKTTVVGNRKMIKFKRSEFFVTDDHLFLTDKGWKTWRPDRYADGTRENDHLLEGENREYSLQAGDMMVFFENGVEKLIPYDPSEVEEHDFNSEDTVYDITLDGDNTFIVEGFVVHNCGGTCFLAGTPVTMADGSIKKIEDVKVGEYVMGAFGEANIILAKDDPFLGNRYMYRINGEHETSDDHPHVSVDKKFYAPEEGPAHEEWGNFFDCELEDGSHEMWLNVGLTKRKVQKMTTGIELVTQGGSKVVDTIEKYQLPPDTKLYNFVVGGSHTYLVNGYAVTGWPREDDFDYDTWTPTGKVLTIEDYRK
jgi:Hom_end-associated Hint